MNTLLKINSTLRQVIKYKSISVNAERKLIHIGGYTFRFDIVNQDAEFIGQKYKKFLWFKFETMAYENYKQSLKDLYYIGFNDGNSWHTEYYIGRVLKDALETGILLEEVNILHGLLLEAEDNINKQNQLLIDLEKKLEG